MMRTAFDKIKAGLDDAIAFADGDTGRGVVHIPEKIDVRGIRDDEIPTVYADIVAVMQKGLDELTAR